MNNTADITNRHYRAAAAHMLPLAVAAIESAVPHTATTVRTVRGAVIEMAIGHFGESFEAASHMANFAALAWVKKGS